MDRPEDDDKNARRIAGPHDAEAEEDALWMAAEKMAEQMLLGRTGRLKDAVKRAGGPAAVARRTKIPLPTLTSYLAGRDMRTSALVALARGCDVSIGWLADGIGSMRRETEDNGAIFPGFTNSLADIANFWALFVLLRSCQEFHHQMRLTPTLAEVFEWVGPLYDKAKTLPDRRLVFTADDEEEPST